MSNDELQNWWTKIGSNSFFFDGALKSNPGIAGACGVIFYSKGIKQKEYSWGIRRATNNGAEWLTLIKGLEMVREWGSRK